METRPLREQDIDRVAALYSRVFNKAPWNDGWSITAAQERLGRFLANPDALGVLAVEADKVLGFALGACERWVNGEHFHLKEMCTDPERQRQGIGSAVLAALCADLQERGVQAIICTLQQTEQQIRSTGSTASASLTYRPCFAADCPSNKGNEDGQARERVASPDEPNTQMA